MSLRILIAEDEGAILRLWEQIFTRLGHLPTCVTDGAAALKALQEQPFDVLVTDLRMPVMSGFELLETVRKDPALREIETYVCSGFVDDPDQLDGFRVRRIIDKPFRVSEELAYFREALSKS